MEKNQNIQFDFTQPQLGDRPLAVMDAELAKAALKAYAKSLEPVSKYDIMGDQLDALNNLKNAGDYEGFVLVNLDFVLRRQLIDNVTAEKWDAYNLKPGLPF